MNLLDFFNIKRIICTVFGIVFIISGTVINVLQITLYILLKPFDENLFNKLNYYLSYSLYSQIVFLLQYWANVKVTLHVVKKDYDRYFGKEHALLIMNHSYEIDWMIGWILCDNSRILGSVKTFAKKSLQYLPIIGYSWSMGGSMFLERSWEKDRKKFDTSVQNFLTYADPFWLLLTAEGTRFTKEKHEASRAFARQHGLPELRHHLTPRTKGFTASVPILRKSIEAIYNINVGVREECVRPTLTNILLGKSINAELLVERIPMKDLPESETDLADWLHSLYKRKVSVSSEGEMQKKVQQDDLMHNYLTTGNWVSSSDSKFDTFLLPRRIQPAANFACWFVAIMLPLAYIIIKLLLEGSFFGFGIAVAVMGCSVYALDKLVGETKISKASTYGTRKDFLSNSDLKKKH